MTELPHGWASAKLNEIADVRLGRQRSPKNHTGSRMRPYLRAANVTWGGLDLSDVKEMNFTETESETYELRPGDVVVAEASGSPSEVGKPAIWRGEIEGCCFQNTLIRVRQDAASSEFLHYFLLSEARAGRIGKASPGVGIHHIGAARLSSWVVPFPPLNEQRRIVAAIEEHLSRLDAGDASIHRSLELTSRLRQVVVASTQDRRKQWQTVSFDESFDAVSDQGRRVKRRDYLKVGAIPVIDQGEGHAGGFTDDLSFQYRGPLPVLVFGDHTRRVKLVTHPFAVGADGVKLIAPKAGWDPRFALLALQAIELPSRGYGRHYQLLRRNQFLRPSLEEQRGIVDQVDEQLSSIDALRRAMEHAQRRSATLRRAVLNRAFRGALLPQDPSDEPASVLLERIRAERAAAPPQSRQRRVSA